MKILQRVFGSTMAFCFSLVLIHSCQTVDPGERTVVQPQFFPDPTQFGTTIHPLLQARCASTECHGRPATFRLHDAPAPLPPVPPITHPLLLPEPFRTDYFSVLYYVDLDQPDESELLRFAWGSARGHPGGAVLSDDERNAILDWLAGVVTP